MSHSSSGRLRGLLLAGCASLALLPIGALAQVKERVNFDIPGQDLGTALTQFGQQSEREIVFPADLTRNRRAPAVHGELTPTQALDVLLADSGLRYRTSASGSIVVEDADPQGSSAGGGAETNVVQELVVTAQKKSENIQVVPIAISAFTQQDLTTRQVAGGPDLMTQVPNMTFTKTNFSSYSIQIRGIGTQAISATTDAAVAVAFNNTPFIRNRFFEQEFYDLERVEVLRGPQGTLYGRNATAGVVNIISAKPSFEYEERLSVDVGNYGSHRVEGMVNVPLVDDKVALRLAGSWTKRDGYDTNQITGNAIDGRDLWSTRLSLRIEPSDKFKANLIWEHFQENDDRLRSGKQLCKTDEITSFAGFPTSHFQALPDAGQGGGGFAGIQGSFSQGCAAESLYSPDSFQTPEGIALPYYLPLGAIFLPTALLDPYVSRFQSHDLRVIESTVDPIYRAKSDLAEAQLSFDIGHNLTLASETAYDADVLFSLEDYNRFNTAPGAWTQPRYYDRPGVLTAGPNGGIFCDPQLGCSDRLVAVDLSTAKSRQFSQEFRLSSDYEGKFNFSLGANFLRYDTEDKYYVFINSLSMISAISPFANTKVPYVGGVTDNHDCLLYGPIPPDTNTIQSVAACEYMDPNPIGSLNDQGHNYFLSRNPYKLISYAMFGEAYYNITDSLKLTGGLRWTIDKKDAPRIPSWLLASDSVGQPVAEVVRQRWSEPTGRLAIDWKPSISFTDQTLIYASYAHGYKAGGANPPSAGPVLYADQQGLGAAENALSATHPKTFAPEFVNAFEVGTKNTLFDGKLTLNADAFYYDYTGYQISQIVDRSAVNLNFDSKVWGAELEADWRPLRNLRLGFKGGYEHTRVDDGMKAVDLMDRTGGHTDWTIFRPFPTFPSNCIFPKSLFVGEIQGVPQLINLGGKSGGNIGGCEIAYVLGMDPVTDAPYVPNPTTGGDLSLLSYHPGYAGWDPKTAPHNGEGFDKDLSGKELPNAPHFTATITADYTIPLPHDWLAALHADLYYQSEAWARIFNTPGYDRIKAYTNINLAAIFSNEAAGWKAMFYVKNLMNRDSITGAFLNSDDTGLTTNIFLTEPRLYGLRVTKEWTGVPVWGSLGGGGGGKPHTPGEPYLLTLEIGGSVQRDDAPYGALAPSFLGAFPQSLQPDGLQNKSLDWGDGREVKLTYAYPGAPWRVSLGARRSKANGANKLLNSEVGDSGCLFGPQYCTGFALFQGTDYINATAEDHDEHTMVDFTIGRDVGFGAPGMKSSLTAGVRYADFMSNTSVGMVGIPDWTIPDTGGWQTPSQHHRYEADLRADRTFKGAGPVLGWEASQRLLALGAAGQVDLDWQVQAGVLFGKQKTALTGEERQLYFNGQRYYNYAWTRQVGPTVVTPPPAPRSKSVSAPLVDLSLGMSYQIQRLKLSTGYRWERYFNVIDGGYAERKNDDRTIDGPYLKVSIGLGG